MSTIDFKFIEKSSFFGESRIFVPGEDESDEGIVHHDNCIMKIALSILSALGIYTSKTIKDSTGNTFYLKASSVEGYRIRHSSEEPALNEENGFGQFLEEIASSLMQTSITGIGEGPGAEDTQRPTDIIMQLSTSHVHSDARAILQNLFDHPELIDEEA